MAMFEKTGRFAKDWADLDPADKERFRKAVRNFVADLEAGKFRPGLRVKRVQGTDGIFEMTFAPDGRASWQYGDELLPGLPHVIWRRIGTHDVLTRPLAHSGRTCERHQDGVGVVVFQLKRRRSNRLNADWVILFAWLARPATVTRLAVSLRVTTSATAACSSRLSIASDDHSMA